MHSLTVVLISKNQEWNIARLIESVIDLTAHIEEREIILVDSASTDRTVEIASQYPVRVLRLSANQFLSPAAGRYVGYQNTSGDYVLFLDGDNELYPGWIEKGFEVFETFPDVAVVTGPRVALLEDAGPEDKPPLVDYPLSEFEEPQHSGGTAMFRRAILEEVGTFNPFLYSDEEPDLSLRIRCEGKRIVKLSHPIAFDYTPLIDTVSTKIKRWRRNLYLGFGQNIRYHWGKKTFWPYIRERGFGILTLIGLAIGILALIWLLISGNSMPIMLWGGFIVLFVIADVIRKRSLHATYVSVIHRLILADGTLRGFLKKPIAPSEYPSKFEVVQ